MHFFCLDFLIGMSGVPGLNQGLIFFTIAPRFSYKLVIKWGCQIIANFPSSYILISHKNYEFRVDNYVMHSKFWKKPVFYLSPDGRVDRAVES